MVRSFGHFTKTKFGFFKKLTSKIASFLTWHMIKRPKGIQASNFWICRKFVRDEIIQYKNYNLYLQVLFYRTTNVVDQYTACSNIMDKYYKALLSGSVDVESTIEQANSELEAAGLADIIAEKQAQLDAYLAEQQ